MSRRLKAKTERIAFTPIDVSLVLAGCQEGDQHQPDVVTQTPRDH